MKQIYPLLAVLCLSVIFSSCVKSLAVMEDRLEGTWRLDDVDRRGIGGGNIHLAFSEGDKITFLPGDKLEFTSKAGDFYKGSWNLRKDWTLSSCYYDEYGNYSCDNREVRTLGLTLVDFTSQDVISEFYNDIVFTGKNKFKAFIYTGSRTWIFHFRRE